MPRVDRQVLADRARARRPRGRRDPRPRVPRGRPGAPLPDRDRRRRRSAAAFPEIALARSGTRTSRRWRGELDYWVFADGQLGRVVGQRQRRGRRARPGGTAGHLSATLTATDRDRDLFVIEPASLGSAPMDERPLPGEARPDRAADPRPPGRPGCRRGGIRPDEIARRVGMSVRTVYRDLQALEEEVDVAALVRGRPVGRRRRRVPAAAQAHPLGGDGRRPVGPADGPLRRQVRPRPGRRVREARGGPAAGAARARRADAGRPGAARPPTTVFSPPRPPPDPGLGGAAGRHARLRCRHATGPAADAARGDASGRT